MDECKKELERGSKAMGRQRRRRGELRVKKAPRCWKRNNKLCKIRDRGGKGTGRTTVKT